MLTGDEVNPVIMALRSHGIGVTALHSHMLDEQPRLFFMHFWANDDAIKLANGVRAALDKVGLAGRERAMPITLSGGEQQRLCIARAVVNRPSILIADEPTANLDSEAALGIVEIFRAFNQVGVTVLVATHDNTLIERFASSVVRLAHGRVAAQPAVLATP